MSKAKFLLIGSGAIPIGSELRRTPRDIDLMASFDDAMTFMKDQSCVNVHPVNEGSKLIGFMPLGGSHIPVEIELTWTGSTAEGLLDLVWDNASPTMVGAFQARKAPLDALYALKMSHRFKRNSPHFLKTMRDIRGMRQAGATIPESLLPWYKVREKETYNYKHPNLNTTKKEFFSGDGISYKYDHDSIHLAIKEDEMPAYNYFKPDRSEVYCSKEMFNACSLMTRLNAVYEESAVLALERSIIAHPGVLTAEQAFAKALEKVCTSITSGWFREFAWEHYYTVLALYAQRTRAGRNYLTLFERGLKDGIVKEL